VADPVPTAAPSAAGEARVPNSADQIGAAMERRIDAAVRRPDPDLAVASTETPTPLAAPEAAASADPAPKQDSGALTPDASVDAEPAGETKPGTTTETPNPDLSRRQAARAKADQQSAEQASPPEGAQEQAPDEREAERQEWLRQYQEQQTKAQEAEAARVRAEQERDAERQQLQSLQQQAVDAWGDNAKYQELSRKKLRGEPLDYPDARWLAERTEIREILGPFVQLADAAARQTAEGRIKAATDQILGTIEQGFQKVEKLPGVNPATLNSTRDFGVLAQHVYDAGKATTEAELSPKLAAAQEKISQLEAQLKGLEVRTVAHARQMASGGAPVAGRNGSAKDWATASSFDMIADGLREPSRSGR
jgi:hypothetical protein